MIIAKNPWTWNIQGIKVAPYRSLAAPCLLASISLHLPFNRNDIFFYTLTKRYKTKDWVFRMLHFSLNHSSWNAGKRLAAVFPHAYTNVHDIKPKKIGKDCSCYRFWFWQTQNQQWPRASRGWYSRQRSAPAYHSGCSACSSIPSPDTPWSSGRANCSSDRNVQGSCSAGDLFLHTGNKGEVSVEKQKKALC